MVGITVALLLGLYLTSKRMEFSFGNEGKIICVIKRDWGIIGTSSVNCFNITPIGEEQKVQKFKCETLNGEIVISK